MAHYYFDLHECGGVTDDPDGVDIDDHLELRLRALAAARDIMCGEIREGRLCLSCHIQVVDEHHADVLAVTFREAIHITGI